MKGRPEPAGNLGQEPIRLQAGNLEMLLCNSALRRIKHGKTEIVRAIYAVVRDRDWGTVRFELNSFDFDQTPDSFRIKLHGEFGEDGILGQAEILIAGKPPANLEFCFQFTAGSTFLKNRIGICVLLPIEECKGRPYHQIQSDGREIRDGFPVFIAPHQPLLDIRILEWDTPGHSKPRLVFEGDVFEMEDQRNWTDASFKIYSTPLSLPFPVQVNQGDTLMQKVYLSLPESGNVSENRETDEIRLTGRVCRLPYIGVSLEGDLTLPGIDLNKAFSELPLNHIRADARLSCTDVVERIQKALAIAEELGCFLELVLLTSEGFSLPDGLMELLKTHQLRLARMMVYSDENFVSNGNAELKLLSQLRENLTDVSVGGGSNANFAELNRNRIPTAFIDFTAVAANPQVHATDDLSLVENLDGLHYLLESVKRLYPGEPVVVSPLSLKPRFNPVAAPGSKTRNGNLDRNDPRFNKAFGAMWTLCAIRELAQSGTESVTLHEKPSALSPLYKALGFVYGPPGDWQILDTVSTRPGETEALVFKNKTEILVMVLNFSDQTGQVRLPAFSGLPELIEISDTATVNHGSVSPGNLNLHNKGIYILRYLS